jgi:hypothetical protein
MRIFIIFISIIINLYANELIIKYQNLKKYYYKNQIINLKLKIITPKEEDINFSFPNGDINVTKKYFIYNINIKFKNNGNITLHIISKDSNQTININKLYKTKKLENIPKFCKVLAEKLKIQNPISTKLKDKILLSFIIKTKNANLEDFNLTNEENLTLINQNEATYYTLLPKDTKKFIFYYFNTKDENFKKIQIPIILEEETISTQTDINPEEKTFFTPINILLLIIIALFLLIFIIYQYLIILIIPITLSIYLIFSTIPKGEKILKANSPIRILPTRNSTIFYIPKKDVKVKIINKTKNYTKIEINKKIGWVKNENLK